MWNYSKTSRSQKDWRIDQLSAKKKKGREFKVFTISITLSIKGYWARHTCGIFTYCIWSWPWQLFQFLWQVPSCHNSCSSDLSWPCHQDRQQWGCPWQLQEFEGSHSQMISHSLQWQQCSHSTQNPSKIKVKTQALMHNKWKCGTLYICYYYYFVESFGCRSFSWTKSILMIV